MRSTLGARRAVAAAFLPLLVMSAPARGWAHCDGLDGPVVRAAQAALEKGDVNLALIWVPKADEAEVRKAFDKAVGVRKLGPDARDLADRFFFETVVRVHRAAEGVGFTGLKPAGRDLGPAIPAADKAVASGSLTGVEQLLTDAVRAGLGERFRAVQRLKDYKPDDVAAGRRYVEAYVAFVHYVEGLYEGAGRAAHGHAAEPAKAGAHDHGTPHGRGDRKD
jgi:Family of unknown function (DUF6448)